MKLLLVNDQGESVACLEDVEAYDVQNAGNVLALLDFVETLIAAAKGTRGSRDARTGSIPMGGP